MSWTLSEFEAFDLITMELTDYLSAFEDFLRSREMFSCSREEMDSYLQTLPVAKKVRDHVKETILKNPPPTLKVHGKTVSLTSCCYIDSIQKIQNILQEDETGKLSHIMHQIRKSLGHTQRKMVGEISTILNISGEERVAVEVCEQKQRLCEAKVKMHHYLLLEGLQDVIVCLSEAGKNNSLEDVWKSCKTTSAPLAMQKVGMNQGKFEKTLKSYPEAFKVEDGKVFLKDNPRITYSLILSHMQSAKQKLKDHLCNQGPLLKNELFRKTSLLLSRAELLAVGGGLETFTFTLESLRNDFLLIPPHMLVVSQGTSQVQNNPFVSAVAKIKDFIRSDHSGKVSFGSQLLTFVNETLDPCEQAAVGNTSQKLRETIAAYPDHFSIKHDTVFIKSDDAILPGGINLGMQNQQITEVDQEVSTDESSSDQCSEYSEDSANSCSLDSTCSTHTDSDVCHSVQKTKQSEDSTSSDTRYDTASPFSDNDVCSSVQNTEHSEDMTNTNSLDETALPCADNSVSSSEKKIDHSEDSGHHDTLDDTDSLCTNDNVCSCVQNTEHSQELANPDSLDNTAAPSSENDVSSSVQNSECSEEPANPDSLVDTDTPCADDSVNSTVENIDQSEDSTCPDTLDDAGSLSTNNDVCSCVQNTEHSLDLAHPDPVARSASPCSHNDVSSSVQNSECSEESANPESLVHAALPCADNRLDGAVKNIDHSEDSTCPDTLSDTGSLCISNDACSCVQSTEHFEDLTNPDSLDDTATPCADNSVSSSVQSNELPEDSANPDSLDDTAPLSADNGVDSSVKNIDHAEDSRCSDALDDTGPPNTNNDVCSSVQRTEHPEDSAKPDPFDGTDPEVDDDNDAYLEQDEVESHGSETISDSESLYSGANNEVGNLDPDSTLPESACHGTVTILQDRNYFGKLIQEFLSRATYPVLSVSLSSGWLIVGLWDGHSFAITLTLSSCDHQKMQKQSERNALDFFTNKSILKVVLNGKQLAEINKVLGLKMVKVFDLWRAQCLIRSNSKKYRTLPDVLRSFGINPCPTVDVCIGTIQAPIYGRVYSKKAILKLKEAAKFTVQQVPYLYQKMLGMMTSYQITEVTKLHDAEAEDHPVSSGGKEEPPCSSVASSNTGLGDPVKTDLEKCDSDVSSSQAETKPEKPISVHRVSSTSGDLDEPDSKSLAHSRNNVEENLPPEMPPAPAVDSSFLINENSRSRDNGSQASSGSRTTSKKIQAAMKQEKSSHQVTDELESTVPQTAASEQGLFEESSPMISAKVLHYDEEGKTSLISFASKLANEPINPCQVTYELSREFNKIVNHDQDKFMEAFGICIKYKLKKLSEEDESLALDQLTEVVMDVGRKPSARYYQPENPNQLKVKIIGESCLTKQDLKDFVEGHCSPVTSDHRTSIKGTLHRVGIMCNRQNEPIGITALSKHAVLGCATPLFDLMNRGQSILFVGNPGVGKSTILREAARVLNDVVMRRVVIVDTCNEIAGDGDIPHPAIGGARRVQLPDRDSQPDMIREVVRNHSPLTVVIDEVLTKADAAAVLATRQRGIQVITSALGQTLQDIILNPNLRHLSGRIQTLAMNPPYAAQHGVSATTFMQRTQPAAFDILVEMYDRYRWIVHTDFTRSIDLCLQNVVVGVQERRVVMKEVSKASEGIPQVKVRDLVVTYPLQ